MVDISILSQIPKSRPVDAMVDTVNTTVSRLYLIYSISIIYNKQVTDTSNSWMQYIHKYWRTQMSKP